MPRRYTSLRRRSTAGLTWRTVAYLFFGPDSNNCPFSSPEEARPVWVQHQKTLLRWWRTGMPADFYVNPFGFLGQFDTRSPSGRPWAWWKLSAPEPRRLLSVWSHGAQRPATDEDQERARALGMGLSPDRHECAGDVGYYFEDDATYFGRINPPEDHEDEAPASQPFARRTEETAQ